MILQLVSLLIVKIPWLAQQVGWSSEEGVRKISQDDKKSNLLTSPKGLQWQLSTTFWSTPGCQPLKKSVNRVSEWPEALHVEKSPTSVVAVPGRISHSKDERLIGVHRLVTDIIKGLGAPVDLWGKKVIRWVHRLKKKIMKIDQPPRKAWARSLDKRDQSKNLCQDPQMGKRHGICGPVNRHSFHPNNWGS